MASIESGSSSFCQYSLHGNAAATVGPHSSRPGSAASSQQVRIFCFFRTIGQIFLANELEKLGLDRSKSRKFQIPRDSGSRGPNPAGSGRDSGLDSGGTETRHSPSGSGRRQRSRAVVSPQKCQMGFISKVKCIFGEPKVNNNP